MARRPGSFWHALRERPLGLGAALVLLLGGAWALAGPPLVELRGVVAAMDEAVLLAFRTAGDRADPVGSAFVEEAVRDVTGLGGFTLATFLVLASMGFLALAGRPRTALYLLGMIAAGVGFVFLLKSGFDRPRPELVPHGSYVATASFPSGHAATAAVVYLTLGATLARVFARRSQRALAMAVAVIVTLAVGVSRVYLGVHWPTDVLAGWTIGTGWAVWTWTLERALQRRGALESAPGAA